MIEKESLIDTQIVEPYMEFTEKMLRTNGYYNDCTEYLERKRNEIKGYIRGGGNNTS